MAVFLFDKIIFGPVRSRRLGVSLGINLLPNDSKFCNFNCFYCECGWTKINTTEKIKFHKQQEVKIALEEKLIDMKSENDKLDVITFAGNGEPTLHPEFDEIIDDTIELRNKYFPNAEIAVLSNSTMLHKVKIFNALNKIEQNILKIDSALEKTINLINRPLGHYNLENVIKNLKKFNGNLIIQTMFIKGTINEQKIDNTTHYEVNAWLNLIKDINPKQVMIYTIARDTPHNDIEKISVEKLNEIACKVENFGIAVKVSG